LAVVMFSGIMLLPYNKKVSRMALSC